MKNYKIINYEKKIGKLINERKEIKESYYSNSEKKEAINNLDVKLFRLGQRLDSYQKGFTAGLRFVKLQEGESQ